MKKVITIISIIIFTIVGYILFIESGDYHPNWKDNDIVETRNIGDEISDAIIKYYKENKKFPRTLDKLVPKYISHIESPKVGNKKWKYDRHEEVKNFSGVSIVIRGEDEEIEPVMILTIKSGDLSTVWYFDSK